LDELKLIFASNLIRLRQSAGLTQAELGEKINYSDKSISKWERGEAIPDAFVLKQLAAIFKVTVDDLLTSHDEWKKPGYDMNKKVEYSQLSIILCCIAGIATLCLLEFVIVWIVIGHFHWTVLFAALPVSLIVVLVLNSIWYKGKNNMYIVGALVLSAIVLVYLLLLQLTSNYWQILLLIVPAELIVFIAFHIRKRALKNSHQEQENEAQK